MIRVEGGRCFARLYVRKRIIFVSGARERKGLILLKVLCSTFPED